MCGVTIWARSLAPLRAGRPQTPGWAQRLSLREAAPGAEPGRGNLGGGWWREWLSAARCPAGGPHHLGHSDLSLPGRHALQKAQGLQDLRWRGEGGCAWKSFTACCYFSGHHEHTETHTHTGSQAATSLVPPAVQGQARERDLTFLPSPWRQTAVG